MKVMEQKDSIFNHEELLLREYDFFPRHLQRFGKICKVTCDLGVYALKRSSANEKHLNMIDSIIKNLLREGYEHVLPFCPNKFGDPYVVIDDQCFYVLPWVEDRVAEKYLDKWEGQMLEALGKLHRMTAHKVDGVYQPIVTEQLLLDRWNQRSVQLEEYRQFALARSRRSPFEATFISHIEQIQAMVQRAISFLKDWQKRSGSEVKRVVLTHGQFYRQHVLHEQDAFFLINFDYARYDTPAIDLAKFFRKYLERAMDGNKAGHQWLERYEAHFPLSPQEKSLFAIMLIFPERVFREVEIFYRGIRSWSPLKHARFLERQIKLLRRCRAFVIEWLDI